MQGRYLIKLQNGEYEYRKDGCSIAKGSLLIVTSAMEAEGCHNVELALNVMELENDQIAEFGVRGHFTVSRKAEEEVRERS